MTDTRRYGAYEITPLIDGRFTAPLDVVIHAQGEAARSRALEAWGQPVLAVDVNCFLLRGPDSVGLIDSGAGIAWGSAFGRARPLLADLGITPDRIDWVLLTHLHDDHGLGLLDGPAPFLPRAEILVPDADLAHFGDHALAASLPADKRRAFDMTASLVAAYGDRLRTLGQSVLPPGIEAIPLPGHSPGHTGYLLQDLLFWGDLLHLGDLQPGDPDIGLRFDGDPALAARTRRAGLDHAAREGWTVAGAHITGYARVMAEAAAWRLDQQTSP